MSSSQQQKVADMMGEMVACEVVGLEAKKPPAPSEKTSNRRHRVGSKSRQSEQRGLWDRHRLGTIDDVCARSGMGRTFILGEIKKCRLVARKAGTRTLIHWDDYEDWWRKLPPAAAMKSAV